MKNKTIWYVLAAIVIIAIIVIIINNKNKKGKGTGTMTFRNGGVAQQKAIGCTPHCGRGFYCNTCEGTCQPLTENGRLVVQKTCK